MRILLLWLIIFPFLVYSQSGPAGVGKNDGTSTLEYWVDANQGVTGSAPMTSWLDISGNSITNTILGNPSVNSGAFNGYDVINFDGTGDYISTSLNISGNTFPRCDIYAVYEMTGTSSAVWGEDNGGFDRFLVDANGAGSCDFAVSSGTGCVNRAGLFPSSTPVIASAQFAEDVAAGSSVIINGLQSGASFTSNHENETSNDFDVGSIGRINFVMIGNIAEVFVFSESLNSAQQIILHNYLSAKYNIGLDGNDQYNEDDAGNGNYDHDVAGIGRVDASNTHEDAQGPGQVRILSPSNLGNNEFLIWGHNNGALGSFGVTDLPATIESRLARDWSASETGEVGTVTVRVDLSDVAGAITTSDLRLLVDADGVYNSGAALNGPPTSLGSGVYEWTGIDIDDNDHFTVGSINSSQTPLPIELLEFNATPVNDQKVRLDWSTATEINNSYFSIERSENGSDWQKVQDVDSKNGNSSSFLSYSAIDSNPLQGVSYYRLKQTDFDGQFSYSRIRSVEIEEEGTSNIKIYPNPAIDLINIEGNVSDFKIYDPLGREVTGYTKRLNSGNSKMLIDLSDLNPGIYYIKTKTTANKVYKQ